MNRLNFCFYLFITVLFFFTACRKDEDKLTLNQDSNDMTVKISSQLHLRREESTFCADVNMDGILMTISYNLEYNFLVVSYSTCDGIYSGNLITSRNNFLTNLKNKKYTISIVSMDE